MPSFGHFDAEQLRKLAHHFQPRKFRDGEYIIEQGDIGSTFYVLADGKVCARPASWMASRWTRGECILIPSLDHLSLPHLPLLNCFQWLFKRCL